MQSNEDMQRRRRILLGLQVLRFVIAAVIFGLAIYFEDVLLGAIAIGFLILGVATTWLRLRSENSQD